MKRYDWAIVGGGVTGILISEILTREGFSVILIEKNNKLAGETTRDFHEWIHTGSLYSLIPNQLTTLKFILGAIDDLIEYYSCYERMNLITTKSGLKIDNQNKGWFDANYIHFKYRIKNRKLTFPWIFGVARSINILKKISKHDWLRRRAGELEPFRKDRIIKKLQLFMELIKCKESFYSFKTPDFTTDSRLLLKDVLSVSVKHGLQLSLGNEITSIKNISDHVSITGSKENIIAGKVAICAGEGIGKFTNVKISKTYAPIAVVSGLTSETKSFVELDYYPKNCINLVTKRDGMGLAGGISFKDKAMCDPYLNYVMEEHKKRNPGIKEIVRYIGIKSELTFENEPRSYLYHIVNTSNNIWAVIPGKFTLGFSLAPEFFRRVYERNPRKVFDTSFNGFDGKELIYNTVWLDHIDNNNK